MGQVEHHYLKYLTIFEVTHEYGAQVIEPVLRMGQVGHHHLKYLKLLSKHIILDSIIHTFCCGEHLIVLYVKVKVAHEHGRRVIEPVLGMGQVGHHHLKYLKLLSKHIILDSIIHTFCCGEHLIVLYVKVKVAHEHGRRVIEPVLRMGQVGHHHLKYLKLLSKHIILDSVIHTFCCGEHLIVLYVKVKVAHEHGRRVIESV